MPNRWSSEEQRTVVCAFRRARELNPNAELAKWIELAQAALPKERRIRASRRLAMWFSARAANESVTPQALSVLLGPWLAHLQKTDIRVAFENNGLDIVARIVAGILSDPGVRACFRDTLRRAIAQRGTAQVDLPCDGASIVLIIGIQASQLASLGRRLGSSLELRAWRVPDESLLDLISEIAVADLVILYGDLSDDVATLLRSIGCNNIPTVSNKGALEKMIRQRMKALALSPKLVPGSQPWQLN